MKEGLSIKELATEVRRQTAAKQDYNIRTHDLQFAINQEIAQAVAGPAPVVIRDLGNGHLVNAEWYNNRGHYDESTELAPTSRTALAVKQFTPSGASLSVDTAHFHETFGVNELAHDQLANYLGIPTKFYDKLRVQGPDLLEPLVNGLIQKQPEGDVRLLRVLDGNVRAFLSNSYLPLDNWDLLNFMLPLLKNEPTTLANGVTIQPVLHPNGAPLNFTFPSSNVTDSYLYLKAVARVLEFKLAVGNTIRLGLMFRNSEVGLGYLEIFPFWEKLECTNGAYSTRWGNKIQRRHSGRKVGADGDDGSRYLSAASRRARALTFFMEAQDIARGVLGDLVSGRLLDPMKKAIAAPITGDVISAAAELPRFFDLSDGDVEGITSAFVNTPGSGSGGKHTIWDLSNAITLYAQDPSLTYDRATDLEGFGGDLITLAPSQWKVLAEAEPKTKETSAGRRK